MPKKNKRPAYSDEQRNQIVQLVRSGRSIASIKREFGVNPATVRVWMRRAASEVVSDALDKRPEHELTRLRAEVLRLRADNERLAEEREAFKKLAALYVKEPSKVDTRPPAAVA